jgi:hypothetical protein
MKAILLGLFAAVTLSASLVIVNNCAGDSFVDCYVGTDNIGPTGPTVPVQSTPTVYSVSMTAEGDTQGAGPADPGPAVSGSVTLNDIGLVAGTGMGYIEFFDYGMTGLAVYPTGVFGEATASFSVGSITGSVPGNDMPGVPQPYAGELIPFTLGVPFDITAEVSFSVAPANPGSLYATSAWATLDFSFSVYGGEQYGYPIGDPLVIEEASSDASAAPEPGTAGLGGLILVLMLGIGKITGAPRT